MALIGGVFLFFGHSFRQVCVEHGFTQDQAKEFHRRVRRDLMRRPVNLDLNTAGEEAYFASMFEDGRLRLPRRRYPEA